jgi:hypothetical protein
MRKKKITIAKITNYKSKKSHNVLVEKDSNLQIALLTTGLCFNHLNYPPRERCCFLAPIEVVGFRFASLLYSYVNICADILACIHSAPAFQGPDHIRTSKHFSLPYFFQINRRQLFKSLI